MHLPEPVADCATFDLRAIEKELRLTDTFQHSGHAARTLVRTSDLRIVLVAMRMGSSVAEHKARETASIQVLSGHVCFKLRRRALFLRAGALLALEPGLPHEVEATEDSAFLLTLGWPQQGGSD